MSGYEKAALWLVLCGGAIVVWAIVREVMREASRNVDRLISDALDERPTPSRRTITTAEWEALKSAQAQARADIEDERDFFAWAEWQVRK